MDAFFSLVRQFSGATFLFFAGSSEANRVGNGAVKTAKFPDRKENVAVERESVLKRRQFCRDYAITFGFSFILSRVVSPQLGEGMFCVIV